MVNVFVKHNGNVLGPIPLEKVLASYRKGQLSAGTMISENQTTWYPITDLDKIKTQSGSDSSGIQLQKLEPPSASAPQQDFRGQNQSYQYPPQMPMQQYPMNPGGMNPGGMNPGGYYSQTLGNGNGMAIPLPALIMGIVGLGICFPAIFMDIAELIYTLNARKNAIAIVLALPISSLALGVLTLIMSTLKRRYWPGIIIGICGTALGTLCGFYGLYRAIKYYL